MLAQAAFPGAVLAATVDHGLREASRTEAAHVAALCAALGVEHHLLSLDLPHGGNLQARARTARYESLLSLVARLGADWLATAHHADDQTETLLMRLNRGAGVRGLAGVRARDRQLVRPLLGWRRAELSAIVEACGVPTINDPSNADDRFDRARLRKAIAGAHWLDRQRIAQSARALADADEALRHYADAAFEVVVACRHGETALNLAALFAEPREVQRRVVLKVIEQHIGLAIGVRESALQRILGALAKREPAMIGDWIFSCRDAHAHVTAAAPRRRKGPPADA